MQGVADDLGHRAVMREHDFGHADEIVVEQRAEHVRLERLDQRGEARNVGEQGGDLATLAAQVDVVGAAGDALREIGREIARQRRVGAIGRRLPLPRLAQEFDMANGLGDGGFQIREIDRLGQEIERAAIHRGADIGHVAIGRDDDGRKPVLAVLQLLQQRQPVHARHIDVGHHHVDVVVLRQHCQRLDAVAGEQKADLALADLAPEFLDQQGLQIRLVVDHEDAGGHAARPTRASISLRSSEKSIGLVNSASAPPSSAFRLVSASP